MFAVSIPTKPTPQSTRTLAAAFVTPGFSKRYAGVRRRRSHQPVRRRTASPFRTGSRKSRRADRRCSGRIAPFAGRPRMSRTCPGAMNRSSGTSSSVRPLGSKWNGASTWVPVWVTMNIDSARKPWASRVVHWVKVGGGYAGHIGVLGPIDWERSTMRENRADRLRGAMGPTGRGTVAGELSGFLGTESFSGDPTQEIAIPSDELERLTSQIITCRKSPRLVRYRESVARTKRAAFRDWEYWGRPVPGWGDPAARLLVVGLAPAAHGGNRTGRVFTGDRSGDWLYRALYRAGFANRPTAISRDDGLELRDCYIVAAVRCAPPANKPTRAEFARCQPYLEPEAMLLPNLRVVVALGGVAVARLLRAWRATGHAVPPPAPRVPPGASFSLSPLTLITSYHPSHRHTPTGLPQEALLHEVLRP